VAQVVEQLPRKYETLSSKLAPQNNKINKNISLGMGESPSPEVW
jgi:hypothetical protein